MIKRSLLAILVLILVVMGYLKIQSYVIGIYTSIDLSAPEVQDMQRFYREFHKDIDTMTWEEFRAKEKERLLYEIKALNTLEPFIQALDNGNQIGE